MIYRFGDYRVDTETFGLYQGNTAVRLDPQEFDVLVYLIEHCERVVSRNELLDNLWKGKVVSDSALSSRLKAIRRAVGDSGSAQRVIQTLHGRGYRFIATIDEQPTVPVRSDAATPNGVVAAVNPRLAGRRTELSTLAGHLDRATHAQASIVFVLGESGIGKSTLVDTFVVQHCERAQALVLTGQTLGEAAATEPYLPLVDALARATHAASASFVADTLRMMAPTWCARFPEILGAPGPMSDPAAPITSKRLLLEFTRALTALAVRGAVLLVLEDLQWADPSTLEWIDYFARLPMAGRILVVGTIRTAAGRDEAGWLAAELAARQLAHRIELDVLVEADVAEFLEARIGRTADAESVAALSRFCGGHPLFMQVAVDSWLQTTGGRAPLGAHLETIPPTLRELVEAGLSQLDAALVDRFEAAAISGVEFTAPLVAAALGGDEDAIERELIAVSRRTGYPRIVGDVEWPDGTRCTVFRFSHHFFAQAIYDRQGASQRRRRHGAIARRLVAGYGERVAEHGSELADHFEKAGERREASIYCALGARYAAERSAMRESKILARRGLELLRSDSSIDREHELTLLVLLGTALIATEGYAAPETVQTYEEALHLGQRLGRGAHLVPVMYGLSSNALVAGPQPRAWDITREFLDLARSLDDPAMTEAWRNVGWSELLRGHFDAAHAAYTQALACAVPGTRASSLAVYGELPEVAAEAAMGWSWWMRGWPANAVAAVTSAVARADALDHAFSLAYALVIESFVLQLTDDVEGTRRSAERLVTHADTHGIPLFGAWARIMLGWAEAELDASERGLALMQSGLAEAMERGATMLYTYFASLLAERLHEANRSDAALAELERARQMCVRNDERFAEAELERLRGCILFVNDRPAAIRAFGRSVDLARAQRSPTLELRAAAAWAEAERDAGHSGAGHDALRTLCATLGPEMAGASLQRARRLLD